MSLISDLQDDLDKAAIRVVTEYHARLQAEALKMCENAAEAEDLVMLTFAQFFREKDRYDPSKGELFGWMCGVMRHERSRMNRRAVERATAAVPPEEIEYLAGSDNRTQEEVDAHSTSDLLKAEIERLDPLYRQAIVLHYFEDIPVKQIAVLLCTNCGTISQRLHIARKILRAKLEKEFGKKGKGLFVGLVLLVAGLCFGAWQAGWFGSARSAATSGPLAAQSGRVGVPPPTEPASPTNGISSLIVPASPTNGRVGVPPPTETGSPIVISTKNELQKTQPQEEKQTMKLTQTFAAAALAVTAAVVTVEADGVTLESVSARQRYPWNGLVDIDYTITYDDGVTLGVDDNLEVLLVDHDVEPAVTNRAITFLQAPLPMTAGSHRITWDANADKVTNRIDKAEFIIQLKHYSEAYMVIDVSGGSSTNCYPVDFLNGAPVGGFKADEYKSNKIVLRRIHPGSYMAGSPDNEANRTAAREKQHRVALSQPFYIGIYEITQKQYKNVTGGDPSQYKGDYRPVDRVTYGGIRGGNWPTTAVPGANTFMDKLIQKCKSKGSGGDYTEPVEGFDLPTEFQWEYACRAGTTGAFNTMNAYDNTKSAEQEAQLTLLGRYVNNQTEGKGGYDANHTNVGSYQPNQWGLYDMHGNVWEWCRDRYQEDASALKQFTDPQGATTGTQLVRGGSWSAGVGGCRSAYRLGFGNSDSDIGFRLSRTLP